MRLSSWLYRAARIMNDAEAIAKPSRAPRRIKNKIIGRLLGPVWRRLW